MEITPINNAIGARVDGVDLAAELDDETFAAIHREWLDRCLLLFRGQTLTPLQLTAFAARFGALEPPPGSEKDLRADAGADSDKDMWIISNVIENGEPIGALGAGEVE